MHQPTKPKRGPPLSAAPGPARLGAAVDVIVGHLRRLVLLQAWAKWEPKLTQVRRPHLYSFSPCSSCFSPQLHTLALVLRVHRRGVVRFNKRDKQVTMQGNTTLSIMKIIQVVCSANALHNLDLLLGGGGGVPPSPLPLLRVYLCSCISAQHEMNK